MKAARPIAVAVDENPELAGLARQVKDRAGSFAANLYIMRNAERQMEWYQRRVAPATEQLVSSSQNAYAAGAVGFEDLIDSERMLISIRRMVVQAQIEREERLGELGALADVDVETLGQTEKASATRAASLPAQ
jgi:outer membrane protein TolC